MLFLTVHINHCSANSAISGLLMPCTRDWRNYKSRSDSHTYTGEVFMAHSRSLEGISQIHSDGNGMPQRRRPRQNWISKQAWLLWPVAWLEVARRSSCHTRIKVYLEQCVLKIITLLPKYVSNIRYVSGQWNQRCIDQSVISPYATGTFHKKQRQRKNATSQPAKIRDTSRTFYLRETTRTFSGNVNLCFYNL